jgi:NAD(P)H-hydrate epimerase
MVCAGSLNYTGAAYLAGSAAARAGAGLVTLALARTIYPIVASGAHETTFVPLPDADGALIPRAAKVLRDALSGYDALLIGPGFGRAAGTIRFVSTMLGLRGRATTKGRPYKIVIDADALYALAQSGNWWEHFAPNRAILTPHPGEMATLCGMKLDAIQSDRIGVAKTFSQRWKQVVVLKGAHTIVAAPDGRVTLIPFATPSLATAGTGDVLAGTITAMLAQGLDIYDAAIVGAYVHGFAGKIAEEEIGRAGVVAGDLLLRLPIAIKRIQAQK